MSEPADQLIRLAVPSESPGGLDAPRSGHFRRSPCFTLVDLLHGEVVAVEVVDNASRDRSGCVSQVLVLGEHMVDAVIVAGIDHLPLLGCVQTGIRVFAGEDRHDVRDVVAAFLDMDLSPVGSDATCLH